MVMISRDIINPTTAEIVANVTLPDTATDADWVIVQQSFFPDIVQKDMLVSKIIKCMTFGKQIVAEFGADNLMAGKTSSQVLAIAAKLSNVQLLLLSGSLGSTLSVLSSITPDANIEQATIDTFKNKIITFLGSL